MVNQNNHDENESSTSGDEPDSEEYEGDVEDENYHLQAVSICLNRIAV